ncbi:MAG: hypothetical protein WDO68_17990 [Gammaproteobacteria bacterium]
MKSPKRAFWTRLVIDHYSALTVFFRRRLPQPGEARAAFELTDRWNVAVNINNLANRNYYQTMGSSTSGNWYGEPRSYTVTFRGSF